MRLSSAVNAGKRRLPPHSPVGDRPKLSPGEREVARLFATGHTHSEIASRRGCTEANVSALLSRACAKLGVSRRQGHKIDSREVAHALANPGVPRAAGSVEQPLSLAQKLYLQAFDRYLRAWANDGEDERRARLEMRYMLGAMYLEAEVPMPTGIAARGAQRRAGHSLAAAA